MMSHSITGSLELTELLMVVVIFAALPLVSLKGEHVVFDSLDSMLPSWVRKIQQGLIHIICAALLFSLAYLMWQTGAEFAATGETTATVTFTAPINNGPTQNHQGSIHSRHGFFMLSGWLGSSGESISTPR